MGALRRATRGRADGAAQGIHAAGARVLVLGLAFKENCPDLRNTRVIDIVARAARLRRARRRARSLGRRRGGASTNTASSWSPSRQPARYDAVDPGGRAPRVHRARRGRHPRVRQARRGLFDVKRVPAARRDVRREAVSMRVLVTGAAGFIGSHVAQRLLDARRRGGRLRQPQRLLRRRRLKRARLARLDAAAGFRFVRGRRWSDRDAIERAVRRRSRRSAWCNLAAQAGVRYSLREPARLRRQQHRRLPEHARGLPPPRRRAPGVRLVQLGLRRQHASCRSR